MRVIIIVFSDLPQDQVTSYLQDNPEFLEKYVLSHVSQDQLERWIIRRAHNQKQNKHKNSNELSGKFRLICFNFLLVLGMIAGPGPISCVQINRFWLTCIGPGQKIRHINYQVKSVGGGYKKL
jgi:hypothetical protein